MNKTHPAWVKRWSKPPYLKTTPRLNPRGYGTIKEPDQSIWFTTFLNALGSSFKEGIHILDYGCGPARLANTLSQHLKEFTYTGLEPPYVPQPIKLAKKHYDHDPRITLTFTDTPEAEQAIQSAHHAILASVLTHLTWPDGQQILTTLTPILHRGGTIVLSIFLAKTYNHKGKPVHRRHTPTYATVYHTIPQLNKYAHEHGLRFTIVDTFLAQKTNLHTIITLTKT